MLLCPVSRPAQLHLSRSCLPASTTAYSLPPWPQIKLYPITQPHLPYCGVQSITDLDGSAVANSIMAFSEEGQSCADPASFRADMHRIFKGMDHDYLRTNTTDVISKMMDCIRRHQVRLQTLRLACGRVMGNSSGCLC
jgi:hypothetical protein